MEDIKKNKDPSMVDVEMRKLDMKENPGHLFSPSIELIRAR